MKSQMLSNLLPSENMKRKRHDDGEKRKARTKTKRMKHLYSPQLGLTWVFTGL